MIEPFICKPPFIYNHFCFQYGNFTLRLCGDSCLGTLFYGDSYLGLYSTVILVWGLYSAVILIQGALFGADYFSGIIFYADSYAGALFYGNRFQIFPDLIPEQRLADAGEVWTAAYG